MNSGNKFILRRIPSKLEDAVVPGCDSLNAYGSSKAISQDVIQLNNDSDFNKIYFHIEQEKKYSADTIYINIVLSDVQLFDENFSYHLFFPNGIGNYQSKARIISIPKSKVSKTKNSSVGLEIQDMYPNSEPGRRCYQRIYFKIFERYDLDLSANYITVKIDNFNQCFVDRMDVDNDLLYLKESTIIWMGKRFQKVVKF